MARFILISRKQREALEFQAIGGGKNAWFPWKWAVGKKTGHWLGQEHQVDEYF